MSSRPWRGRDADPAALAERAERLRHLDRAREIFKLPERLWGEKVALMPRDVRPEVQRCLELLKAHMQVSA